MLICFLQAYRYQEEYELALDGFGKAAVLDPEWNDPKEERRKLENYLRNTQKYIEEKVNHGITNALLMAKDQES